jgi:hypothetical protein
VSFPEEVVRRAWRRAGGTCECRRTDHGHTIPCGKSLLFSRCGRNFDEAGWKPRQRTNSPASEGSTLANCEILCGDCDWRTP